MSKSVAIGKRNFAYKTCSEYNFKKYYKGATYVPFESAISMQKYLANNSFISVTKRIDNDR